EHGFWIRVTILGAEHAELDVVERGIRESAPDVICAQPLDASAGGTHRLVAPVQTCRAPGVSEKEIPALAEIYASCLVCDARAPIEILIEPDAVLDHPDVGGERELLPDAPHCQAGRRPRIAVVTFDDDDSTAMPGATQVIRDAGPDDTSANDHDLCRRTRGSGFQVPSFWFVFRVHVPSSRFAVQGSRFKVRSSRFAVPVPRFSRRLDPVARSGATARGAIARGGELADR